ncbi:MAG TPA: c-type cytochrome [Casimicrobiaceae bacterium]
MKLALASIAAVAALVAGSAQAALDNAAAEALMKKDGCAVCHSVDKKIVGPSYQEVAAKYKGDAGAAAKLIKKVKDGGSGVWGPVPMPPNATTSDADIKNLVDWILTLKK